jgi:16S rRNA (adenine1518-N6/adenine1519-N6)-dimethyltransferase
VGSAIVVLKPYQTPKYTVKSKKRFFEIVHAAFQQRRKKIRNSLANFSFKTTKIDFARRPETLSLADFVELTNTSD